MGQLGSGGLVLTTVKDCYAGLPSHLTLTQTRQQQVCVGVDKTKHH